MKSILLSIQPKWCELIASGKKTVEIRKIKPKLDTPFKVYIYCTKPKQKTLDVIKDGDYIFGEMYHGETQFIKTDEGSVCDMWGKRQKVIGEFVCDNIDYHSLSNLIVKEDAEDTLSGTCLTKNDVFSYLGYEKGTNIFKCKNYNFYGWHISDLVIYDKPRNLWEFKRSSGCKLFDERPDPCFDCNGCKITRPPQSWCYV